MRLLKITLLQGRYYSTQKSLLTGKAVSAKMPCPSRTKLSSRRFSCNFLLMSPSFQEPTQLCLAQMMVPSTPRQRTPVISAESNEANHYRERFVSRSPSALEIYSFSIHESQRSLDSGILYFYFICPICLQLLIRPKNKRKPLLC